MKIKNILRLFVCTAVSVLIAAAAGCAGPAEERAGFSADDIVLRLGETDVRCGDNAENILALLGSGYEYSEAISCNYAHNGANGSDGMDKFYDYANVSVTTCPVKPDGDYISSVEVYGGDWTTAAGIGIGSSVDDIEAAYGTDYHADSEMIIFYSEPDDPASSQLYFVMDGDTVLFFGIA